MALPELSQQQTAKLVLLGEMGSGKSSLVLRYVKGQFFDYQVSSARKCMLSVRGVAKEGPAGWVQAGRDLRNPRSRYPLQGNDARRGEALPLAFAKRRWPRGQGIPVAARAWLLKPCCLLPQASTVGAAFLTKTIPELNVKFEIW